MDHENPERQRLMPMSGNELQLRAEIEELKHRLAEQQRLLEHGKGPALGSHPSRTALWTLAIVVLLAIGGAFLAGYLPRLRRQALLAAEAASTGQAVPVVNVVAVERSPGKSELVLPGNIQAITEAPILARASGYIKKRNVDIGDRVQAGQLLAEIEAPELTQQVRQAQAALEQARSSLEQISANLEQGRTNAQLAHTTAERWSNLAARGVVSKQENDQYQAQYEAQTAAVHSLEKAVAVGRNNVSAAEANLARLTEMQGYRQVRAPFPGVITLRNVDVGALITEGSTLLFRIAQTSRLRTYVNVPQADAHAVHPGQPARLTIPDLPRRQFQGVVTRTSNSLDPATRTLLTEIQAPNPDGALMPGMYADVDLTTPRTDPPMLIPGDTLVVRADGPQVAVVTSANTVHFQRIQLGRDFGDRLEVLSGLQPGQQVIVNPGDAIRENVPVKPSMLREKKAK